MKSVISIQYLRGIAAILVLLQHVSYKDRVFSDGDFRLFGIGNMGVDIFFIISGFIMAYTFSPEMGAAKFLYNRVLRIIPLYWLTSVIALIGYLYVPSLINGSQMPDVLSSFFLLPSKIRYLNPNGWTLRCEFIFYFIFAFSFLSAYRFKFVVPSIILACLAFVGISHRFEEVFLRAIFNPIFIEFLFGMIIFQIYSKYSLHQTVYPFLPLTSALLAVFSIYIHFSSERFGLRIMDLGIPALFICIFMISLESKLRIHVSEIMKSLGDSSYSLYLSHAFTIGIAKYLLSYFGLVSSSLFFSGTLIVAALIVAYFCYRYVELPLSAAIKTKLNSMMADINLPALLWRKNK